MLSFHFAVSHTHGKSEKCNTEKTVEWPMKIRLILLVLISCGPSIEIRENSAAYQYGQASWEIKPRIFKLVVCNLRQIASSSTIFAPLWFIISSLVFYHLRKLLFSGFLQFKDNTVQQQLKIKTSFNLAICMGYWPSLVCQDGWKLAKFFFLLRVYGPRRSWGP